MCTRSFVPHLGEHDLVANPPTADGVDTLLVPVEFRPRKRADVLELDMEDGVILYDSDASLVHHLNPSASVVWHLSEGDATVQQLATEITDEYRLDMGEVEVHVTSVVSELAALGLIEDEDELEG